MEYRIRHSAVSLVLLGLFALGWPAGAAESPCMIQCERLSCCTNKILPTTAATDFATEPNCCSVTDGAAVVPPAGPENKAKHPYRTVGFIHSLGVGYFLNDKAPTSGAEVSHLLPSGHGRTLYLFKRSFLC